MANLTRTSLLEELRETSAEDAWAEFSSLYSEIIGTWLARQDVLRQDVDDLRQDVMATVYREIQSFRHNGRTGAFRCWLRRITVNRMYRLWEKRKREGGGRVAKQLSDIADQLADDNARLSIEFDRQHDARLVEHLLAKLEGRFEPKSLLAFRRIVLQEHASRDVAADLKMSVGAVRVAQHRVLRSLKNLGEGLLDYDDH